MKKLNALFVLLTLMFSSYAFAERAACDFYNILYSTDVYCFSTIEKAVVNEVNLRRAMQTPPLPPLARHIWISQIAVSHTEYMIQRNQISHDGFSSRSETIKNKFGAVFVSEVVAKGYSSASSVVNAWMNSTSHRAALLGNVNHAGIAVRTNASGQKYYTLIMARIP